MTCRATVKFAEVTPSQSEGNPTVSPQADGSGDKLSDQSTATPPTTTPTRA